MKIAVLSDIHEGLNRKNTQTEIMASLKEWINTHLPDVFIISGDMTAGPEKSLTLLNQLQNEFPQTRLLFVHGNHDVYSEDSKSAMSTITELRSSATR
ncbi:metallophosphoesterase family protein [Peribacillus cavernae]|uniref:metallophosphoesterase family protein n=1 Tax=Peribacillus cavernae TaxID=1674310 RepID=UPI001FE46888|nr:metallophosphoesterase [Peribacillus cavernae]MDQ0218158.1 putative MPP superfamily phosphohydrolase [Peribacillus cavernae]